MVEDWTVKPIKLPGTPPQVRLEFTHRAAPLVIVHTETVTWTAGTTGDTLRQFGSQTVKRLDADRDAKAGFDALPNTPIEIEEIEDPKPPVKDPDREAFMEALQLVRTYEKAVAGGLTDGKGTYTARLATAQADMKSKYKEEYLSLLTGI